MTATTCLPPRPATESSPPIDHADAMACETPAAELSPAEAGRWARLVAAALADPAGLGPLLAALEPLLGRLARQVAWRDSDDAVQAARVAIWQSLGRVDLSRPSCIRAMLMRVAWFAMHTETRRQQRQVRQSVQRQCARSEVCREEQHEEFSGLLGMYLEYIRHNGTFIGAHRCLARRLGVSPAKMTRDFHQAAAEFVRRQQITPPRKAYAAIIQDVLEGRM